MDRNSMQRQNRPAVAPSRSSHARLQFVGFGLAPPPKRKNIPKAERSKVLQDAEELVRAMEQNSDQTANRESEQNLGEEHAGSAPSSKYRFMLEKPWRTAHTVQGQDEPSQSHVVQERVREFKNKDPKTFSSEPIPQRSLHDAIPDTVLQRRASRIFDDLYSSAPSLSNESLGLIIDGSDNSKSNVNGPKKHDEDVTTLKHTIEQLKRDHAIELKRSTDEHSQALNSAQQALEQAQLSARVKLSSLERKLLDANQAELKRQEELVQKKSKLEAIENQLAAVELDRRMEVTSLQRKLVNAEVRIQEFSDSLSLMISHEECDRRIRGSLAECEEKHRISQQRLKDDLTAQRRENDRVADHLAILQEENGLLMKRIEDLLNDHSVLNEKATEILVLQNSPMAAKITKLEEESVYSEAPHIESLETVRAEKESLAKELKSMEADRLELLRKVDELTTNLCANRSATIEEKPSEKTVKTRGLLERLSATERKFEEQQIMVARLKQENQTLTDQLTELKGLLENQASLMAENDLKQTIQSLEAQLAVTTAELVEKNSYCAEKVRQYDILCQEMEELKTRTAESTQSLRSECVKSEIMLSDMASNIKVLEKLFAEAKRNLEVAEERSRLCERLQKKVDAKEQESRELEACRDRMTRDLEDVTNRETCLREEMRDATESHRKHVDELGAEISRCNTRVEELQQELANVAPLTQEVGRVKMALHNATEDLRLARSTIADQSDQLAKLEHELRATYSRIRVTEEQLEYANQRKDETTTQLSNLESAQANEQEILSEELRESETTIACLMEELELLRSIAPELESAELALEKSNERCFSLETTMKSMEGEKDKEIRALQSRLEDSHQEITDLRLQLVPLTKELQQTSRELEELKQQLSGHQQGANGAVMEKVRRFEEEILLLRAELEDSTKALELSEQQLVSLRQQSEAEVSDVKRQLFRSRETNVQLKDEVNLCRPKVEQYERMVKECESLMVELAAKEKQINICRLQLQDIEEERNFCRARIAELDDLLHQNGSIHTVLENKTNEVAQLKAERDTLRQKLNVVTAMATALEEDNKQKKQLVHEIMSRTGDVGGLSMEALVESLQNDLERTLKRCADLSLIQADSQFQIDQLTEQLRRTTKNGNSNSSSSTSEGPAKRAFRRSGSYDSPSRTAGRTTSISAMFANSFSVMDESLRGAVTGIGAKVQLPDVKANHPP